MTSSDCLNLYLISAVLLWIKNFLRREFSKRICSAEFYYHTFKFQLEESQNSEQRTEENLVKCGIMKVVWITNELSECYCLSAKGCSDVVSLVCHFILHVCSVMMKVKNQDTLCNLDVSSCVLIVFIFHLHLKIILHLITCLHK
jgi:hypothetical protein